MFTFYHRKDTEFNNVFQKAVAMCGSIMKYIIFHVKYKV